MANKKIPGRPFLKGNKFGKGRPRLSKEEKAFRKMTTAQIIDMISTFGAMTKDQLHEHVNKPAISMLELSFCKMWIDIVKNGDHSKFEFILNRAIGKVKEKHEINSTGGVMILRPNGEKVYMGANPEEIEE